LGVALAERDGALATIRTLLDRAVAGQGGAVFVLAEAGLGKTALLDQAVELATGRMAVGIGRADVAEAALPFGLLGQALRPLIGSEVLDVADGTDRADERAANHLSAILGRLRQAAGRPR